MYQNLKSLRTSLDMTQEEFGKSIDVAKTTYSNYEQGIREPKSDFWISIANKYNVTVDYLMGRCNDPHGLYQENKVENIKQEANTPEESELIKKYRYLDRSGQETVKHILNHEFNRVETSRKQAERIAELESETENSSESETYRYPYLHRIACAGTGFLFDDIPIDTVEVPYVDGADFIVGVNGDSMEPDYYDGELLYVRKTDWLNIGDIGIFTVRNECYVKEFGEYGLISHNKKYSDIPGNEDVRIIGKVIGKVSDDYA